MGHYYYLSVILGVMYPIFSKYHIFHFGGTISAIMEASYLPFWNYCISHYESFVSWKYSISHLQSIISTILEVSYVPSWKYFISRLNVHDATCSLFNTSYCPPLVHLLTSSKQLILVLNVWEQGPVTHWYMFYFHVLGLIPPWIMHLWRFHEIVTLWKMEEIDLNNATRNLCVLHSRAYTPFHALNICLNFTNILHWLIRLYDFLIWPIFCDPFPS